MIVLIDLWIEPFEHFNCALRRLLSRQLQPILIQMVVSEVLHQLALVSSKLIRSHKLKDATRLDEAQDVNLS